jgi:ArsR family transcriptional regulator
MESSFEGMLQRLRAAGEPTRLRLLTLLAAGELTVTEICEILGQSQPRVSRHLRVLCEAGLLDRFREDHWVYYRVPVRGPDARLAAQLLAMLPPDDPVLRLDADRRERTIAARVKTLPAVPAPDLGDAVRAELGPGKLGDLLDIGTGEGNLLCALAPQSGYALGVDISTDRLRIARTHLHVAGLGRCEVKRGDMYQLACADASFDTITMDRVVANAARPADAVCEAARVLRPGGRLVIVEEFDRLVARGLASPLNTVRSWLLAAGLECRRLHPVDSAAGHLLLALGRRECAADAAA